MRLTPEIARLRVVEASLTPEAPPSLGSLRKFWVHPGKGEVHEFDPEVSHQDFVRDHSTKLGIAKKHVTAFGDEERAGGSDAPYYEKVAFDRGWARAYRVSGSTQVHDHIAIEHRGDLEHVSKVVKTLADHGIAEPHHQIHIENNYGSPLGTFSSPGELHHAAIHGGQMGPIVRGRINSPDTVPHYPHVYETPSLNKA